MTIHIAMQRYVHYRSYCKNNVWKVLFSIARKNYWPIFVLISPNRSRWVTRAVPLKLLSCEPTGLESVKAWTHSIQHTHLTQLSGFLTLPNSNTSTVYTVFSLFYFTVVYVVRRYLFPYCHKVKHEIHWKHRSVLTQNIGVCYIANTIGGQCICVCLYWRSIMHIMEAP